MENILKELRIGNIIDFHYEKMGTTPPYPVEVIQILCSGVEVSNRNLETVSQAWVEFLINDVDIKPIPLNENWLKALGFEQHDKDRKDFRLGFLRICEATDGTYNEPDLLSVWLNIKYVHQLQNLFYALTNDELKLRDSKFKN